MRNYGIFECMRRKIRLLALCMAVSMISGCGKQKEELNTPDVVVQ